MIDNRVKKLRNIEAQQKELEAQADAIQAELKADLEKKGVDELKTKDFIVRWKEIISSRLDSKALKAALPDVYGQFCKPWPFNGNSIKKPAPTKVVNDRRLNRPENSPFFRKT